MKKIYGLIIMLFCLTIIHAQDEEQQFRSDEFKTIFGGKKVGGYGAIGAGYTLIDNKDAFILNARGGVVLGHGLALGLTGTCFMNEYSWNTALQNDVSMVGGYGGFFIEPILFPKSGIHVSFPVTVGIGGLSFTTFNDKKDEWNRDNNIQDSQTFFIVEPGVEIEFNFFKFMRMSLFSTYRYASNLEWDYTSSKALNNFSAGMVFKFGKF